LEAFNSKLHLTCLPRYLVKPERREGKQSSSIVVSLADADQANYLIKHGVLAMGTHHRVDRYYATRPWDQCGRCQGFGHHYQRCKSEPKCKFCAAPHTSSQHRCDRCNTRGKRCQHTVLCCANCGEPHMATQTTCYANNAKAAREARQQSGLNF
jgi:hypothetical protein